MLPPRVSTFELCPRLAQSEPVSASLESRAIAWTADSDACRARRDVEKRVGRLCVRHARHRIDLSEDVHGAGYMPQGKNKCPKRFGSS